MVTFRPLAKSSAAEYFKTDLNRKSDGADAGHYLTTGAVPPEWGGKLAATLGLTGPPTQEQLQRVLDGYHPLTGEDLVQRRIENRRQGSQEEIRAHQLSQLSEAEREALKAAVARAKSAETPMDETSPEGAAAAEAAAVFARDHIFARSTITQTFKVAEWALRHSQGRATWAQIKQAIGRLGLIHEETDCTTAAAQDLERSIISFVEGGRAVCPTLAGSADVVTSPPNRRNLSELSLGAGIESRPSRPRPARAKAIACDPCPKPFLKHRYFVHRLKLDLFLERNILGNPNLKDMEKRYPDGARAFRRECAIYLGMTVCQWYARRRIELAYMWIRFGKHKLEEIACVLGLRDLRVLRDNVARYAGISVEAITSQENVISSDHIRHLCTPFWVPSMEVRETKQHDREGSLGNNTWGMTEEEIEEYNYIMFGGSSRTDHGMSCETVAPVAVTDPSIENFLALKTTLSDKIISPEAIEKWETGSASLCYEEFEKMAA